MGKKGLSFDEKRKRILEIYYQKKEVFNLKEIEKLGAKKGVILQAIKDVNQSLVDDNLVETDKIGIGTFFWALPSMGFQSRQNLIRNLENNIQNSSQKNIEIKAKVQEEQQKRDQSGIEISKKDQIQFDELLGQAQKQIKREDLLKIYKQLKEENESIKKECSQYERCAPERVEEMKLQTQICKASCERWVDNLFQVSNWLRKNNAAISMEELENQFEVLQDLDYVEEYRFFLQNGGYEKQKKLKAEREKEKQRKEEEEQEKYNQIYQNEQKELQQEQEYCSQPEMNQEKDQIHENPTD